MKIRIINKSQHALPEYGTIASAGVDLRANIDAPISVGSLEKVVVPLAYSWKYLLAMKHRLDQEVD